VYIAGKVSVASRRTSLFALLVIFFIDNLGLSIVYPIFGPLILHSQYHLVDPDLSKATLNILIAILIAIFSIAQFFGAPFWGDMADQFGRKKIFYFTILGTLVGYILSGISLELSSYTLLFISRLISGFFAGNLSLCLSSIADLNPDEKKRAKTYGWVSTLGGISWVIGIILGGESVSPHVFHFLNPSTPFWATAILTLISFATLMFLYQETHPTKKKVKVDLLKAVHHIIETLRNKNLRLLYLILFFWMLGWSLSITWFSSFSTERFNVTIPYIMWALVILGIIWGLGSSLTNGYLLKKLSLKNIVVIGLGMTGILMIIGGFLPTFISFAALYIIASHFAAFTWSNTLNLVSISAPGDVQGRTMGFGQSMLSLAQLLAPIAGGLIADVSLKYLYVYAGVSILIGLVFLVVTLIFKHEIRKT